MLLNGLKISLILSVSAALCLALTETRAVTVTFIFVNPASCAAAEESCEPQPIRDACVETIPMKVIICLQAPNLQRLFRFWPLTLEDTNTPPCSIKILHMYVRLSWCLAGDSFHSSFTVYSTPRSGLSGTMNGHSRCFLLQIVSDKVLSDWAMVCVLPHSSDANSTSCLTPINPHLFAHQLDFQILCLLRPKKKKRTVKTMDAQCWGLLPSGTSLLSFTPFLCHQSNLLC